MDRSHMLSAACSVACPRCVGEKLQVTLPKFEELGLEGNVHLTSSPAVPVLKLLLGFHFEADGRFVLEPGVSDAEVSLTATGLPAAPPAGPACLQIPHTWWGAWGGRHLSNQAAGVRRRSRRRSEWPKGGRPQHPHPDTCESTDPGECDSSLVPAVRTEPWDCGREACSD